jgi:competence protein ComEC
MIWVSVWVASLPGSVGRIAAFGTGPLALATAGILLLGLLKTQLRYAGAFVVVGATVWALNVRQPDILIAADGSSIAARAPDGRLRLVQTRKDAFVAREWLAADADGRLVDDASISEGAGCDPAGCALKLGDGWHVTIARRPDAFADDCARAIVVVTFRQPPADCRAVVVGRERLNASGSLAAWRSGDEVRFVAARPQGSDRPWAHREAVAELAQAAQPAQRPAATGPARPVDATPPEADLAPDDQ